MYRRLLRSGEYSHGEISVESMNSIRITEELFSKNLKINGKPIILAPRKIETNSELN